ncbi:Metallophosphoesterase domain-containing protein 1 [Colletotrichum siamense]|uniref:Metallophosphoesterase domain-containing protein 1 n=1 Tax=Colletotrichum siamense TaxID=690259 RepID=UPI001872F193|nr:Metallophosphoesterase domain-containing protein 1 [Colletotrichum siamense]KAF5516654.1 Metallophosphoesterase domain-containing protein 1 [Colletotrichum siamense]
MPSHVATKILVLSDTHGQGKSSDYAPNESFDVVIHCGDLTQHSKIAEFRDTLQMLSGLKAPLKLVIAGNHDFTLDSDAFKMKINEANHVNGEPLESELIDREFGTDGEARRIIKDAERCGIMFLDEGTHQFDLQNGGVLRVYASPYTPSKETWAYSYDGQHEFNIQEQTDVVITHGPPQGIMDMSSSRKRLGCPQLFGAVARSQPRMHCFGHVHCGWGAKLAKWRPEISDIPSHFSDIDNDKSMVINNLAGLRGSRFESEDDRLARLKKIDHMTTQKVYLSDHSMGSENPVGPGQTLFVNAAVEGDGEVIQPPWGIVIDLPTSK